MAAIIRPKHLECHKIPIATAIAAKISPTSNTQVIWYHGVSRLHAVRSLLHKISGIPVLWCRVNVRPCRTPRYPANQVELIPGKRACREDLPSFVEVPLSFCLGIYVRRVCWRRKWEEHHEQLVLPCSGSRVAANSWGNNKIVLTIWGVSYRPHESYFQKKHVRVKENHPLGLSSDGCCYCPALDIDATEIPILRTIFRDNLKIPRCQSSPFCGQLVLVTTVFKKGLVLNDDALTEIGSVTSAKSSDSFEW